ncbi:MAG: CRISPR-associated endonuclease Cas1 [Thermodesulfobacteriota bacterium]
MASLYVDSSVDEIRADGRSLALYRDGRLAGRVPLVPLERVVIQGNVAVQTRALHLLADEGVGVHLVSGRQGAWRASVVGREHKHVALRVAQVRAHLDPAASTAFARRWVGRKLSGQLENAERWLRRNPSEREKVHAARVALEAALGGVEGAEVESLRGIEGAAARAYFGAMAAVLPPSVNFQGRNRRPPLDPANALLSLTYTLIHAEWADQLRLAGFDPGVGFFHALEYGRESLACDLVEPCRPAADRWVVSLFNEGVFRASDFGSGGARAGCWLKDAARRRYYLCYEEWVHGLRPGWRREAYELAGELAGEVAGETGSDPVGGDIGGVAPGQAPKDSGEESR